MYLIESWRESVQFLLPKNAKLFTLLSLKNAFDAYLQLFKIPVLFFSLCCIAVTILYGIYSNCWLLAITAIIVYFLFSFMAALLVRSSVNRKESAGYLRYYLLHYFMLISIVYFCIALLFYFLNLMSFFAFVLPLVLFRTFFFVDSRGTVSDLFSSCVPAIKMFVFNLPFCLFMSICMQFLIFVMTKIAIFKQQLFGVTGISFQPLIILLIMPLVTCFFMNFYIKRLHDQFSLYYPSNVK